MTTAKQQQQIDTFMAGEIFAMIRSALPNAILGEVKENYNDILFSMAVAPFFTLDFIIPLNGFGRWRIDKSYAGPGMETVKRSCVWSGEPPMAPEMDGPDLWFMRKILQNWRAIG